MDSVDKTVRLTQSMVGIPAGLEGVRVEELYPDSVRLTFEEIIDRALVLVPQTEGDLPEGLSLSWPIQVTPSSPGFLAPKADWKGWILSS